VEKLMKRKAWVGGAPLPKETLDRMRYARLPEGAPPLSSSLEALSSHHPRPSFLLFSHHPRPVFLITRGVEKLMKWKAWVGGAPLPKGTLNRRRYYPMRE